MKKKNLFIGVALATALLIGLASCGDKEATSTTNNVTTTKETTPVVEKYKIVFVTNGGTSVDEVEAEAGEAFTLSTPAKAGYTFEGWYKDADLTDKWSGDVMPKGGATLYAKWSKSKNPADPVPTYIDNYYSFIGDFKYELNITDDNYKDVADMMELPEGMTKDDVINALNTSMNSQVDTWSYTFYFKNETELYDSGYEYSNAAELESDINKNGFEHFSKTNYTLGTENVINFVDGDDYLAQGVWSVSSDNKYVVWDMGFVKIFFGIVLIG